MTIEAVIFDMDGLLIDSEPLWQDAEVVAFGRVGLRLTRELCTRTMGLRVDDVVSYWRALHPWDGPSNTEVERWIIDEGIELISRRGEPMAGAVEAVTFVKATGVKVGLASSSPKRMMRAVIDRLGLDGAFDCIHSAETEEYGKPHPAVYLTTARELGVAPTCCLAVEDSLIGVIAARAARMGCIAVPEPARRDDPRFSIADVALNSLVDLTPKVWARLGGPPPRSAQDR
jgi:mannitol-1-/sugar-/sorbitol-6-/2-deoxyglucose-6-phosphatase